MPNLTLQLVKKLALVCNIRYTPHCPNSRERFFFPGKRCNYQNHNRKEIVSFFLYLATKETFPSCPNATLPRKKYFFIIKSPVSQRYLATKEIFLYHQSPPLKVSIVPGSNLNRQGQKWRIWEDANAAPQEQMINGQ